MSWTYTDYFKCSNLCATTHPVLKVTLGKHGSPFVWNLPAPKISLLMSSKGVDAVYIPCHWMSQTAILKTESLYMTSPLAQLTGNTLVMVNKAITLCYCDTKISKVQSFSIEKWGHNKLMEHWLSTIQSQVQGFKFPLVVFKVRLSAFHRTKTYVRLSRHRKKCSCFLAKSHSLCHNTKR